MRTRHSLLFPIIACCLLAMTLAAFAAEPPATPDYRLGPDDAVSVTVLRHPELSAASLLVTADGQIQLPVAGAVPVAGKTVAEVQALVVEALRSRLVNPEVTVSVVRTRPNLVFVIGAVNHQGPLDLKPGWRVTEALAGAGGLTTKPDLIAGSLFRANRETLPIDLPALLLDGNSSANHLLQPGDVLNFTEKTIRISVAGQVQKPGTFEIPVGYGVVQAIASCGGITPRAALSKAHITHLDGTLTPIDLYRVMVLGEVANNVVLRAGDLIMVPESKAKFAVLGAVGRPGYYDIEEGTTPKVSDAVALAGGAIKYAQIDKIAVMRTEDGESKRITVNLKNVLKQGKVAEDLPIREGDIVFVPDPKTDWGMIMQSLGILRWVIP